MKQRLLSPHHPLPLPPGTGQASTLAVKLLVWVGCDGSVLETDYVDGSPELFEAANEVARKWKYGQTFMNGAPCEVDTTATVAFGTKPIRARNSWFVGKSEGFLPVPPVREPR